MKGKMMVSDRRNICLSGADGSGRVSLVVVDVGEEKEGIEKAMAPSSADWQLELSVPANTDHSSSPIVARYVPRQREVDGTIQAKEASAFHVYEFDEGVRAAWGMMTSHRRVDFDIHDFSSAAEDRRAAMTWRNKQLLPPAAETLLSLPLELIGLVPPKSLLDYSVAYLSDQALLERFSLGMMKIPARAFFRVLAQSGRCPVMGEMWSRREAFGLDRQALNDALWHVSIANPREDVASWLISTGADVNALSSWAPELPLKGLASPVLAAAIIGFASERYLEFLLCAGADPNARDEAGVPVMAVAAEQGWNVMQQLHKHGAAFDDYFVLHRAVVAGHEDVVEHLIRGGINLPRHREALWEAICSGKVTMLRQLVNAGMPLDRVTLPDRQSILALKPTPLDPLLELPAIAVAVNYGEADMIGELVALGGDVNAPGPDGRVPLIDAAEWARMDAIDALLDHGAEVPQSLFDSALISEATKSHIYRRLRAEELRETIEAACVIEKSTIKNPGANQGRRSQLLL